MKTVYEMYALIFERNRVYKFSDKTVVSIFVGLSPSRNMRKASYCNPCENEGRPFIGQCRDISGDKLSFFYFLPSNNRMPEKMFTPNAPRKR